MKKFIFLPVLALLLACCAPQAEAVSDEEVRTIIRGLVVPGHKVEDVWNAAGSFRYHEMEPAVGDVRGCYGEVERDFPYKSTKALHSATNAIFSRRYAGKYLYGFFGDMPKFKDVDGKLYRRYQDFDGDPEEYKWITKSAKIVAQTDKTITASCQRIANRSKKISDDHVYLVKEDGKWRLDCSSYPQGETPQVHRAELAEKSISVPETADFQSLVMPVMGDEDYSQALAAFVCLGFWDTTDFDVPTPYIRSFVANRLTAEPEYFLEGTKIFVIIPRHKDAVITVQYVNDSSGKKVFSGKAGRTLIFAGNTPNGNNTEPIYSVTVTHDGKRVTFAPDIDVKNRRPLVEPDEKLLDMTEPPGES